MMMMMLLLVMCLFLLATNHILAPGWVDGGGGILYCTHLTFNMIIVMFYMVVSYFFGYLIPSF